MVGIDLVHKFDTSVSHMLKGLFTEINGFQLKVNRNGCHMWDKKCSLFLKHIISCPFHSFNIKITEFVSLRTVYGLMTGLFAWISLTALSQDGLIIRMTRIMTCKKQQG